MSHDVLQNINQFYEAGEFTDVTIACGPYQIDCHKIILCAQSKFFKAACSNGFKGAAASQIDLSGEDLGYIKLMLEFLYTQTYDVDSYGAPSVDPWLRKANILKIHIGLYTLGDKYAIPSLCRYAASCFRSDMHHLCWDCDMDMLLDCIPSVYASCPENDRTLRDILLTAICYSTRFAYDFEDDKMRVVRAMHDHEKFCEDMTLRLLDHWVNTPEQKEPGNEEDPLGW
ncbi:MAG: hypothetical protein Q9178_004512 [Gyalolechia marmorata]